MIIESPLFIRYGIKKTSNYYLNLNSYRNRHYRVSNKLKIMYKEIMSPKLKGIKKYDKPIKIEYRLFFGDHGLKDISNFGSIIDKFFQDCLVENGIIKDDNFNYVIETKNTYGGYDKGKGRCEIYITE